jgi:lysophospholipase L1-like esterase
VERYAAHLGGLHPPVSVRNLAMSGFTTFQVLPTDSSHRWGTPRVDPAHNVTAALEMDPSAIIVNLPSNDAALGFTVEETLANLRTVVATAAEVRVPTWVSTSQPRNLDPRGIAILQRMRSAVLQEFRERSLDFFSSLAEADGTPLRALNQGDGIHPNAEGHRLLFEVVKSADIPAHLQPRRAEP